MDNIIPWVAVVDDDDAVRHSILRMLRVAEITACGYASGFTLFASIQNFPPGCVVLDIHMPVLSGFDVLDQLRVSAPDAGIVFITGKDSPNVRSMVERAAPVAYLQKPVATQDLLDAIQLSLKKNAEALRARLVHASS